MTDKKNTDKKDAGKAAAATPGPGPDDNQVEPAATSEIETVEDLEIVYPKLVSAVRDEVVMQISRCTLEQVKTNMPELYQRLVMDVQNKSGPNLNVPGFLLEVDDPFAEGTLRTYQSLTGLDGLRLPFIIPFKEKGQGDVNEALLKIKFEKSAALKADFKDVGAFLAFKSRIITQVLENYVLRAEGGGDYVRAKAARLAMKKIK